MVTLSVIIIAGSIGLGSIFWLNLLGGENEDLESGALLLEGTFVEFDMAHYGRGTARIVTLPNGNRQLQFIDVDIAIGPDLFVYLSNKATFSGIMDSPGTFIDLGALPHNLGNFSINVNNAVSLNDVHSVLIWCKQFSVAFTYATLT